MPPPIPYALAPGDRPRPEGTALLLWLARRQWRGLLGGAVFGAGWMLTIALIPAAVGRGVDALTRHDLGSLVRWSVAVLALGLASAVATDGRHFFAVRNWISTSFRGGLLADEGVRRAGPALTRELPAGEVLAVFASDFGRLGSVYDVFARACGAVVSFVVVAVILLRGSLQLGLVILLGGPVLLATLALVVRPLQRRQEAARTESGRLTTLGADTVAGLRVLRGIGGEDAFASRYAVQSGRVRDAGYRLAPVQATLDAAQVLLPGVFVAVVTTLGAHLALAGEITPGQLVAYYGYTAFLTMPLRTVTELVDKAISSRVAAGRVARVVATEPDHPRAGPPGNDGGHPPGAPAIADLVTGGLRDPASGLEVRPAMLTALVGDRPEESAALASRLGRVTPGRHGVTLGGHSLDDLPVATVRRLVCVSESEAQLFSGPVLSGLLPPERPRASQPHGGGSAPAERERVARALHVASAEDVLDGLEGGLEGRLEERGRGLSGGQRQRLVLVRALLREAPILVLVEPTSAVDAHTEARIGERLAEARRGRTTVVTTASPLILDRADEVVLLAGGRVVDRGTHRDLLARSTAYRDVVTRGEVPA